MPSPSEAPAKATPPDTKESRNGVVALVATFIGIWLIGKHGSRPMLLTGLGFVIATQVALGAVLLLMSESLFKSYAALACILCFLLFMQMLISPVYWLLMSELFPMHVRGVLTGTAVACQWVFNGLVALLFPIANGTFRQCYVLRICRNQCAVADLCGNLPAGNQGQVAGRAGAIPGEGTRQQHLRRTT